MLHKREFYYPLELQAQAYHHVIEPIRTLGPRLLMPNGTLYGGRRYSPWRYSVSQFDPMAAIQKNVKHPYAATPVAQPVKAY